MSGQVKHGMCGTPEYTAFRDAKKRCTNPRNKSWKWYGGRGIQFRFESFEQFFSEIGPRPIGTTLDRRNNDGHYESGNIHWVTQKEQGLNRRARGPQTEAAKTKISKAAKAQWSNPEQRAKILASPTRGWKGHKHAE